MTEALRADAPIFGGRLINGAHELPVRVYYEDTDAGGILYHAGHIRFFERGRTDMLRCLGFSQRDLREEDALFVVRRMEVDYLTPAVFDDLLTVRTEPIRLGGASFDLAQTLLRGETVIAQARVSCVTVTAAAAARRMPESVRAAFSKIVAERQRSAAPKT